VCARGRMYVCLHVCLFLNAFEIEHFLRSSCDFQVENVIVRQSFFVPYRNVVIVKPYII